MSSFAEDKAACSSDAVFRAAENASVNSACLRSSSDFVAASASCCSAATRSDSRSVASVSAIRFSRSAFSAESAPRSSCAERPA